MKPISSPFVERLFDQKNVYLATPFLSIQYSDFASKPPIWKEMVEMFDLKALGKNVKEARMKAGLIQSALADKAGFASAAKISRFENGSRTPSLEALASIARALNTTPSALLDPDYSGHKVHETAEVREISHKWK